MDFEWNRQKAESNIQKHSVAFEEATSVFGDTLSITFPDPDHSIRKQRHIIVGLSSKNRILIISHVYYNETIRIISARRATKPERKFYEGGK